MKITKYIHSCLLIEKGSDKILFDPGLFTFAEGLVKPSEFQDIEAIIITHKHPDHIDGDSLKEILENNENAVVLANSDIEKMLAEKDIEAELFESGERAVGSFVIKAIDAPHEKILADELPKNTAYIVDAQILHPGDSYSKNLYERKGMPILCLPTMAPWTTEFRHSILPSKCHPNISCRFTTDIRKISFSNRVIKISKNISIEKNINFNG